MKITVLIVLAAVGCGSGFATAEPNGTSGTTTYEKACVTTTPGAKGYWVTNAGVTTWVPPGPDKQSCQMIVGTDPNLANSGCNGRPSENGPCPEARLVGCCVARDLGPGYDYIANCSYTSSGRVAVDHCSAGETWQTTVPQ